jgi:diadenylate cyclase
VAQRLEMVRRIAGEIEGYMVELGTDGRMLALHLDELVAGTGQERVLLVQDYVPAQPQDLAAGGVAVALARLESLGLDELLDVASVAEVLGFGGSDALDDLVSPHGYRLLARIPRIPMPVVDSLIEHFGGLQKLLAAGVDELNQVDGVGAAYARSVREGLSRLAESSVLERYV